MYLTYPPEVARTFPETVQRLIGYDFAGPYLGFVDSGSSQTLLKAEAPDTRERTRPEIDAAFKKLKNIPFGEEESRISID